MNIFEILFVLAGGFVLFWLFSIFVVFPLENAAEELFSKKK